jgi:hypothetical protein
MKRITFLLFFVLLGSLLFPVKLGTLAELIDPDNITLYNDELYVVQGPTIFVYSLKDMQFIRKFGKKGQGPGELMAIPGTPNRISVQKDYILAESYVKLIWFTKEGKLIKERKKPSFLLFGFIPIEGKEEKEKFVARRVLLHGKNTSYDTICIFDGELKVIKELYKQKWIQQGFQPPLMKLEMVPDFITYKVYNGKIFIDGSDKGFIIEILDTEGNKLQQIKKEDRKIKFTAADKDRILNRFKEDKYIKAQSSMVGGWNQLKNMLTMNFPNTYPPIRDIEVSDDKIFIRTYKRVKDKGQAKEEYVVMDFKGNILRRVMAPEILTSAQQQQWGAKMNTIHNGKLYYLLENIDEETWELHVHEMK